MAIPIADSNFSVALLYARKQLKRPNLSLKKEYPLSGEAIYENKMSSCGY